MPVNAKKVFGGIDLGRTSMRGVVVSATGDILTRREAAYEPDTLMSEITSLVSALRQVGEIESVGVGIPGLVNRDTDRVLVSTGLPSVVRGDLHSELMKAIGLRVELENDANAAAYGEYKAGAGRGAG